MAKQQKGTPTATLEAEYRDLASSAARFMEVLRGQIAELLRNGNITLAVPLESRVKTWASIAEKLRRKQRLIDSVLDLPDLVGLRIITLFRRDVTSVCNLLDKALTIVEKEDTRQRLGDREFGYQSAHLVAELPKDWLAIPTMSGLSAFRAEIQVRTVSQHLWAAASHLLQYKRESDTPPPLRRAINRASALLETVDLEFERVLNDRDQYLAGLVESLPEKNLDVDVLAQLLNEMLPAKNKRDDEPYAELLAELNSAGIYSSDELRSVIESTRSQWLAAEASAVKRSRNALEQSKKSGTLSDVYDPDRIALGVFYTHAGLVRIALRSIGQCD